MQNAWQRVVVAAAFAAACAATQAATIVDIEAANPSGTALDLAAGTYTASYIGLADGGQYDAWTAWAPNSFCSVDPGGNPVPCPQGYISMVRFEGLDPTQVVVPNDGFGVNNDPAFPGVRVYIGYFDPIFATPNEALKDVQKRLPSFSFTLPTSGVVRILAGEDPRFGCVTGQQSGCWSDNAGGVSLLLSSVPEADPRLLLAAGLAFTGLVARRRRRA